MPVLYRDLSHMLSLPWVLRRFWRMESMRYWLTFCFVGFVRNASVALFLTDCSASASGLCRRQLKAMM